MPTEDMYPRIDLGDTLLIYRLDKNVADQDIIVIEKETPDSEGKKNMYVLRVIATERDMTPVVNPPEPEIDPVSPPGSPPNNPVTPNPNIEEVEPVVIIHEPEIPQHFMHLFNPRGLIYGVDCWALINLICLILTVYLLLPILHLRAKFRRDKLMTDANKGYENLNTEAPYQVSKFKKQFRLGIILEIILALCSIILFIVTENMKLPMVLIDRWTLLMIILLVLCWVVDIQLIRYQEKLKTQEN